MAYSYACKDCEGMESCPGMVVAETKEIAGRLRYPVDMEWVFNFGIEI